MLLCCKGKGSDIDLFEAVVFCTVEKHDVHAETNKEPQNALDVTTIGLVEGRLLAFIALLIFGFSFNLKKVLYFGIGNRFQVLITSSKREKFEQSWT